MMDVELIYLIFCHCVKTGPRIFFYLMVIFIFVIAALVTAVYYNFFITLLPCLIGVDADFLQL